VCDCSHISGLTNEKSLGQEFAPPTPPLHTPWEFDLKDGVHHYRKFLGDFIQGAGQQN